MAPPYTNRAAADPLRPGGRGAEPNRPTARWGATGRSAGVTRGGAGCPCPRHSPDDRGVPRRDRVKAVDTASAAAPTSGTTVE